MSIRNFLYVRNPFKKRDITIVSEIFEEDEKKFVKFAWTFRSNHDQFIKREGRKVALERLNNKDQCFAEVEVDQFSFYEIAATIVSTIFSNKDTPKKYLDDLNEDFSYYKNCLEYGKPELVKVMEKWSRSIGYKF